MPPTRARASTCGISRAYPRSRWRTTHTVTHREGRVTNSESTRKMWHYKGLERAPQCRAKRRRHAHRSWARPNARHPNDERPPAFRSTRPATCAASPSLAPLRTGRRTNKNQITHSTSTQNRVPLEWGQVPTVC